MLPGIIQALKPLSQTSSDQSFLFCGLLWKALPRNVKHKDYYSYIQACSSSSTSTASQEVVHRLPEEKLMHFTGSLNFHVRIRGNCSCSLLSFPQVKHRASSAKFLGQCRGDSAENQDHDGEQVFRVQKVCFLMLFLLHHVLQKMNDQA